MLNTNTPQTIRNTGGNFRLDWTMSGSRCGVRYALQTRYRFLKFVVGQNPNQRFRPQDTTFLRARLEQQGCAAAGFQLPAAEVGFVESHRERSAHMRDWRVRSKTSDQAESRFIASGMISNTLLWRPFAGHARRRMGGEVRRYQLNDLTSNEPAGNFGSQQQFQLSAIETSCMAQPQLQSHDRQSVSRLRENADAGVFVNDRWKVSGWTRSPSTSACDIEVVGAPSEVSKNGLTTFAYHSDRDDVAPRVGFSYTTGAAIVPRWIWDRFRPRLPCHLSGSPFQSTQCPAHRCPESRSREST